MNTKFFRRRFFVATAFLLTWPASALAAVLSNPLGTTSIQVIIGRLIRAMLGVTGSIALLMFIWGGFLWLISAGEPEKVKKGKDAMKWATLGLVVIMGAYMIVNTIITALESGTIG